MVSHYGFIKYNTNVGCLNKVPIANKKEKKILVLCEKERTRIKVS